MWVVHIIQPTLGIVGADREQADFDFCQSSNFFSMVFAPKMAGEDSIHGCLLSHSIVTVLSFFPPELPFFSLPGLSLASVH